MEALGWSLESAVPARWRKCSVVPAARHAAQHIMRGPHRLLATALHLASLVYLISSAKSSTHSAQEPLRASSGRLLFRDLLSFFTGGVEELDEVFEDDNTVSSTNNRVRNCTCSCGQINQEIRIVGGRPTGVNRYPWLARLVYDGQFHCGASLVSEDFVLTAAHCVRKLKRAKIRIILGDHDQFTATETPAIMRAVSAVIRNRNFDINSYNHDIALLKLRKSVVFSKHIRPVCMPTHSLDPAGRTGTVVGWGRTTEGGMLPGILQEVQVPILSLSQCRTMKYKASRITPNMLCAGKGHEDSCQGDSGGPLLLTSTGGKHTIVGVVSWGVGCGRPGYPGVYTRVTRYLDWIQKNMPDACFCT